MKKFAVVFLLLCTTAFAETASLSDVLSWQYGQCFGTKQANDNDASPNPKMVVWYWKCAEPQPSEAEIATLTQTYSTSQAYFASQFNVTTFTHDLGLAFTGLDAIMLSPYLGAYQSYAEAKNFKGINDFTQGLVALGKATPTQAQIITNIFLDQGIILSEWTE